LRTTSSRDSSGDGSAPDDAGLDARFAYLDQDLHQTRDRTVFLRGLELELATEPATIPRIPS